MLWLWYAAPVATLVVWFLTGLPTRHEARRNREIARWRALMAPTVATRKREGYRATKEAKVEKAGPRLVATLPGPLLRVFPALGGGAPLGHYELVEKLAYLSIVGPNLANGSEYQAVVAKLSKPAPRLTAYPLPIIDGARLTNSGIQFKKDPDFMGLFMVEGADAKAIGKWLSRPIRDALRDFPDAWLHVEDRAMALVLYGPVDTERLQELVATADVLFAEHGAEGGPSLLAEDEPRETAGDDEDDEDDGENDEDEDEEEGELDEGAAGTKSSEAKPATASKA